MNLQFLRTAVVSVVVVVVIAAIGYGLYLSGSPAEERLRRFDERRVEDLRVLRVGADAYWRKRGRLPASLGALAEVTTDSSRLRDPFSGEPYGYRVKVDSTYELCAKFERASEKLSYPNELNDAFWFHPQGEYCRQFTASTKGELR